MLRVVSLLNTMRFIFTLFISLLLFEASAQNSKRIVAGKLSSGARIILQKGTSGNWGILIDEAGKSSSWQPNPAGLELYVDSAKINAVSSGYRDVQVASTGFIGQATITSGPTTFNFTDEWSLEADVLKLKRAVKVAGNGKGGFLSRIIFTNNTQQPRSSVGYFAPGMIYGPQSHLTEVAIGGSKAGLTTWIREDRLTAPMFGIMYTDGSSVTVLNSKPDGRTVKADGRDLQIKTIIDAGLYFGSIGAEENEGKLQYGFMWPGTEGEMTYKGKTYPGGQERKWRRRYHPIKDGFSHSYQVSFRFAKDKKFTDYYTKAWRWAWDVLKPQVNYQNIESARRSLVDMLAERVETNNGFSGIPYFMTAAKTSNPVKNMKTAMGFVGKALESANFLLQDADRGQSPDDAKHRQLAIDIINSFTRKLTLSPPNGEGFMMDSGQPVMVRPQDGKMYLRSFGDDLKSLLKAIKREKAAGRSHDDWLAWAKTFGDWLLPQQLKDGGFPRGWEQYTGVVKDASPQSSYTVVPFLVLLTELTGDNRYQKAAVRAAEFCWNSTQSKGLYVGGTIDNPDVIDKEAGTLSTEAYLSVYGVDKKSKWIERAQAAAKYAETWMYIWDIPMPEDESNVELPWKKGVSTVGLQLISTGHSLADVYMAFDVDEYAQLYKLTKDKHYLDVARILLHNTKGMLGLPGREYDLAGPGWQQEHWSLAPMRGFGIHRGWLPWVSTSHLNGIFGLEELDRQLYKELIYVP